MRLHHIWKGAWVAMLLSPPLGFSFTVATTFGAPAENARLRFLSPIFGDYMVIQRVKPNPIRGWAKPGDLVRVKIAGKSAHPAGATANTQPRHPGIKPQKFPAASESSIGDHPVTVRFEVRAVCTLRLKRQDSAGTYFFSAFLLKAGFERFSFLGFPGK